MSKTIRYHLFPKTLFKDHNIVPPQQQTQTERIEPDPKPKSVVNKPLIAASQRLRSINSERVLKQFPKFCLNSQQLTVGNPSSLPRMSDSSSRLSRGSVVRCNETMEKSLNELPKKPTHGQKGNSLYNWVPSSLNSLSPSSDGFQPIIILPLASTRHRHTVSRTFKMQAEVIKSCPTQYGGEEKSATSLENYEEKTPLALSDSNSQSQMNNLDVNSSRCDSQCRGSDNTVESSNRSIENEEKQKSASSRTDSENTVTNLNHQFLGQDLIGRNLRIIDNKAKEGLKYRRQSFKPMLRVENEEGISQDISFATPKNNASNDDDKENTVQGDEVAREEGEKTRNSVRCVKGAKDLKKKNSKKNFKIKRNSQRALTSFHKDVMREEVVKPLAEKKKVNQEDALYFLNESSSSDDDMFVEYVKAVKKNDNLDKLRSLQ